MSYANGTAHYNLPQTVGTDKRDWFDTNQAFADIDAALFAAAQQASAVASEVSALDTRVGAAESDIAGLEESRTTDEARISALEALGAQHTTEIANVKADALDMICAVDEGTAQVASVRVDAGKYFRYNDVLYMADTDIEVGDTIVPNTNCHSTNVATELENISPSGEVVDTTARQGVATNASHIGNLANLQTSDKNSLVDAINEIAGSQTSAPSYLFEDVTGTSHQLNVQTTTDVTVSVAKAGYTPVAIIPKSSGHRLAYIWKVVLSGTTVTLSISNTFTEALNVAQILTVVYQKN